MITHWTVVGYHLDTEEAYVEHVTGVDMTPKEAVALAMRIEPARAQGIVVGVFRGHQDDEYGGLGMSSDEDGPLHNTSCTGCGHPECPVKRHPGQVAVVSHYAGDPYFEDRCVKCMEEPI